MKELDVLNPSEMELLLKAPLLVCILVAGADGTIDKKEIKGAIETTRTRQSKSKGNLEEFYRVAAEDFEDKLKVIIQTYPSTSSERGKIIEQELTELNAVFSKLDIQFASELYSSLREIAMKIAKSSGGLLGINSIGDEEVKYVDLPMIKNLENR